MTAVEINTMVDPATQEKLRRAADEGSGRLVTDEDMLIVYRWIRRVIDDKDQTAGHVLFEVLEGRILVVLDGSEDVKFRISLVGREHVERKLRVDPEMREMMERLNRIHGKHVPLPPFEGNQEG